MVLGGFGSIYPMGLDFSSWWSNVSFGVWGLSIQMGEGFWSAPNLSYLYLMGEPSLDRIYSKQEYFSILQDSEHKYEYVNGFLVNMSGGSINHNRIFSNLLTDLSRALEDQGACQAFGSDLKIAIPSRNSYFFPDLSVAFPT